LSGQAAQSPLFFSLQAKQPSTAATPEAARRPATDNGDFPALPEHKRAASGADQEAPADAAEGARKLAFLRRGPETEIYNAHALQRPISPFQLMAGTVIAASLITGLNSDLPGFVIAAVTENVYDTASGRYLLIPQGARLIGKYDNVVAFGQERALVVWQRIIFPDGSSVTIDNLPATDASGYAGLADAVDAHTWTLLKGVALATLLGVGSQFGVGTGSSSDSDLVKALQQSVAATTNRAGQRLAGGGHHRHAHRCHWARLPNLGAGVVHRAGLRRRGPIDCRVDGQGDPPRRRPTAGDRRCPARHRPRQRAHAADRRAVPRLTTVIRGYAREPE
jgi:type IV secretion system protein VirB10